ncbi:hypothetical protein ACXYN8_00380 [Altererythrobacter sp. CAU 1778]
MSGTELKMRGPALLFAAAVVGMTAFLASDDGVLERAAGGKDAPKIVEGPQSAGKPVAAPRPSPSPAIIEGDGNGGWTEDGVDNAEGYDPTPAEWSDDGDDNSDSNETELIEPDVMVEDAPGELGGSALPPGI